LAQAQMATANANGQRAGREATCDAEGRFQFQGLPALPWIVLTQVQWRVANANQGGILRLDIDPARGNSQDVILSDRNFIGR